MASRIASARPEARIEGFAVEQMVRRKDAHELIIGASEDPQFGPVILFGQGGVAVELLRDRALALPPLNLALARMLVTRTRVYRLLQGYRGKPAADLDGIALTLVRVSQLVIDQPEIVEIDINPLLADAREVIALDARIRVTHSEKSADTRLAIRPYPDGLAVTLATSRGAQVKVRPIRPEDEPALVAAFNKLSLEAVRFRFFGLLKELPHALAARLTQIDYDREMAFVATPLGHESDIWAVARFAADPDNERAEYAITVRSDQAGAGLGYMLLGHLVAHARTRGLRELVGDVLRTNERMLKLAREFGFAVEYAADRPDVFVTRLRLDAREPASLPQPA
jgi:acetyltransferase